MYLFRSEVVFRNFFFFWFFHLSPYHALIAYSPSHYLFQKCVVYLGWVTSYTQHWNVWNHATPHHYEYQERIHFYNDLHSNKVLTIRLDGWRIPQISLFTCAYFFCHSFSTFAPKRIGSRSLSASVWLITHPILELYQPLLTTVGRNPVSSMIWLPILFSLVSSLRLYALTSIQTSNLSIVDGIADLRCGHSVKSRYGKMHMVRGISGLLTVLWMFLSSTESCRPLLGVASECKVHRDDRLLILLPVWKPTFLRKALA